MFVNAEVAGFEASVFDAVTGRCELITEISLTDSANQRFQLCRQRVEESRVVKQNLIWFLKVGCGLKIGKQTPDQVGLFQILQIIKYCLAFDADIPGQFGDIDLIGHHDGENLKKGLYLSSIADFQTATSWQLRIYDIIDDILDAGIVVFPALEEERIIAGRQVLSEKLQGTAFLENREAQAARIIQ